MVRGFFTREADGRIVAFQLTGHAEAGPYGSDIVCAAVSTLAISTINGIEALAGFTPIVVADEVAGGDLSLTLLEKITQEQSNIAQILLENLLLGLQAIEAEYPEYVEIKTVNQN